MTGDMELVLGQQTLAAKAIIDGLDDVAAPLQGLAASLQSHLPGFSGASAGAFAEVVSAWFDKAALIPEALASYAEKLVAVDQTVFQSESQSMTTYQTSETTFTSRLGGPL